ncbi:hypothetical protein KC333_g4620 [Hortaea werneckii]|nr:hypothetical protein KC333_g4620 [Hortaea werneckii]KAI7316054.1 hypothetical protein KC326_g4487 [Hortaea werneckii]
MGKKDKGKKSKGQASLGLQQPDDIQQPGVYQPPQSASGTGSDQQYGYPPQLQSQAQSQDQWPAVQNQAPQPQRWQGGQPYGESSNNMQQQTTTTTKVTRHVQHVSNRRQARGHQEQQQPPPPAQQQNTIDYESLRVTMPAPQPPTPAPARRDRTPVQEPHLQPSPAPRRDTPDWDSLRIDPPASRLSRSARRNRQQTTRTTTTTTESYEGQHDGGETRRKAEAQGPEAVAQYERTVIQLLAYSVNCPVGFNWFNMRGGYICGGGTHWMSHKAIDDYFRGVDPTPRVESLNFFLGGLGVRATVHAPADLGQGVRGPYAGHWAFMQALAAQGGYARIIRPGSRRRAGEAEGLNENPCECVRTLRMRVYESREDNPLDMSRIRNPTYVSSGHFHVGLRQSFTPFSV